MLIQDSKLICKDPFSIVDDIQDNTIIIGIPDKDSHIKKIVEEYKIDISDLSGKWEAFKIVKASKDGNNYLLTLGSDPRGTAYGILELSRYMGISPWVWWADVIPNKKTDIEYTPDEKVHAPSVQYRGIFLNDEDWALMPWSTRTFEPTARRGAIGPKTYERIFELLLRLRANTIWPAMHECTVPFFFVEGNKEIADKYGIVVSNSHAEPMMRTNTGEWDSKERGTFNFLTNEKQILSYWDERAKELNGFENIYTVGMRGIHDGRMQGVESIDDETKVLHLVIDEQRKILSRNNPGKRLPDIPQQFVPYKEVLKAYDNGLKLPEDITLVWCDDNHGNIMRLSNPQEQKRSGGAGVYYHISYWGKPHDYLWLASTQPGLIYSEMKRAWNNGARRLWILNVGDIKPGEYLTEFFLDMAWDINSVSGNTIYSHQQNWIKNTFGN
ncbi:MAG: glycosyl hydrolase 115 family protein, partial [Prevotella sp.]|nr:glycosyl hydrolase 115 family protein [Prevotella sp.]